jgi:hypothetical protein
MTLIQNERTKLPASLFNGLAVTLAAASAVTLVAATFCPVPRPLLAGAAVWIVVGIALHLAARRVLEGMR